LTLLPLVHSYPTAVPGFTKRNSIALLRVRKNLRSGD